MDGLTVPSVREVIDGEGTADVPSMDVETEWKEDVLEWNRLQLSKLIKSRSTFNTDDEGRIEDLWDGMTSTLAIKMATEIMKGDENDKVLEEAGKGLL